MEEHLNNFEKLGFITVDNFLETPEIQAIRDDLIEIRDNQLFKKAGIGRESNFQIDQNQRGDFIHWIDPLSASAAIQIYFDKVEEMRLLLNRHFYLGLRSMECHYTEYPAGAFYKRHVDRHKSGSNRVISFLLYLNEDWKEEDGGQLVIYHEEGQSTTVDPSAGKLALFLSEKEHEVLVTSRIRQSVTGWMLDV
jgi:SM-20-related protein